jgi:hypothetical protein
LPLALLGGLILWLQVWTVIHWVEQNEQYARLRWRQPLWSEGDLATVRTLALGTGLWVSALGLCGVGLLVPWRWAIRLGAVLCVVHASSFLFYPWLLPTDHLDAYTRISVGLAVVAPFAWLALAYYLWRGQRRVFQFRWVKPEWIVRAFRGRVLWATMRWLLYLLAAMALIHAQTQVAYLIDSRIMRSIYDSK